jgi:peptidyl-prolyl cis-trans isomerase A (cyclophilin A)
MKFPHHLLAVTGSIAMLTACGGGDDPPYPPSAPTHACSASGIAASNASLFPTVCVLTSQGELVAELYPQAAPRTVANFLAYVEAGIYTTTLVHRVSWNFVFQGGGYKWDGTPVVTFPPIDLESGNGLRNVRGTLAMARGSAPASATSQFFINVADNSACLDKGSTACPANRDGYAVFGHVISGMPTADRINAVPTDAADRPRQDVVVYWVKRLK